MDTPKVDIISGTVPLVSFDAPKGKRRLPDHDGQAMYFAFCKAKQQLRDLRIGSF